MSIILAAPAAATHAPAANWRSRAACTRHTDPDALFASSPEQRRQVAGCRACPVQTECLGWALDTRFAFGVMGGMTERQRRALLKRRPDVESWTALLDEARRQHEARQSEAAEVTR